MSTIPASRNDPCPCGSGKRYKHCHGATATDAAAGALLVPRLPAQSSATAAKAAPPAESPAIAQQRARAQTLAATDPAAAIDAWERLLIAAPGDPEALFHLGNVAREQGDNEAAIAHFTAALERAPGHYGLANNLGLAYKNAGRLRDAEDAFRVALAANPEGLEPLANLAQNLYQQQRYEDALTYFEPLVQRYPEVDRAAIHANRGVALSMVGRLPEADTALTRALELEPGLPSLQRDIGLLYIKQMRWSKAAEQLELASRATPDSLIGASMLETARSNLADWRDGGALRKRLIDALRSGALGPNDSITPFDFMAFCDDPALQRAAAATWVQDRIAEPLPLRTLASGERLRLGFVSSDFGNHPVARLLLSLLETLDRNRFESFAYLTRPVQHVDRYLDRVKAAVRAFVPIDRLTPDEVAARVRADRIDILFDLNGLTGTQATAAFARRPAPMQVNFLGYTGTMAEGGYDFIVTDRHCLPEAERGNYRERPLFVEPCYLPSDATRDLDPAPPSRAEYGLPDAAFVLAMFAAPYKFSPALFDRWMNLLRRHPDSVMWLRQMEDAAVANLRAEAQARGVASARLVFAPTEPIPRYLARFRHADLFLDTYPFGTHTTVNDALFAGLPVVTQQGRSFASRASASQVLAAGLPELVADSAEQYEAIAEALLTDRPRLAALTARLRDAGVHKPLFDAAAYARAFEAALRGGWAELARERGLRRG
jgi:protein O-GlcNAc transferase